MAPEQVRLVGLFIIQMVVAYEWMTAGWGKVTGEFTTTLSGALTKFASENPFLWYKAYLEGFAASHVSVLAPLVAWGELLAGVGLFIGGVAYVWGKSPRIKTPAVLLSAVSVFVGAFMNAQFYFAAGWTSPSTHGVNMVMFWVEVALLYVWIAEWRLSRKR